MALPAQISKLAEAKDAAQLSAALDAHLLTRTFVTGHEQSDDDAALFDIVTPHIASLSDEQRFSACNVCRWFDLIQHRLSPAQAIKINTNFPLPAEPVAAAPAKKADNKKQQDNSKAKKADAKKPPQQQQQAKNDGAQEKKAVDPEIEAKRAAKKAAKDAKQAAKKAKAAAAGKGVTAAVSRLEIVVGRIVSVEAHPTEERLFVEKVDIGKDELLDVVSGFGDHFSHDDVKGRLCCVILNLKASDVKGVPSAGRILAASNESAFDMANPPADAKVGEPITFPGVVDKPDPCCNSKNFNKILKGLKTDEKGVCLFQDLPFTTSAGVCTSKPGCVVK